jgi:DNA-directed RNA polymerase specialized sigma subunit
MREIGQHLGISHVRVVKIRENIRRKVADQLVA